MREADLYASFKTHLAAIVARRPKADDVVPAPPSPDPALVEFERVRSAALARQAAEKKAADAAKAAREAAQAEEDRAVETILKSHAAMLGQSLSH